MEDSTYLLFHYIKAYYLWYRNTLIPLILELAMQIEYLPPHAKDS